MRAAIEKPKGSMFDAVLRLYPDTEEERAQVAEFERAFAAFVQSTQPKAIAHGLVPGGSRWDMALTASTDAAAQRLK